VDLGGFRWIRKSSQEFARVRKSSQGDLVDLDGFKWIRKSSQGDLVDLGGFRWI
jgi:hypothetical protein